MVLVINCAAISTGNRERTHLPEHHVPCTLPIASSPCSAWSGCMHTPRSVHITTRLGYDVIQRVTKFERREEAIAYKPGHERGLSERDNGTCDVRVDKDEGGESFTHWHGLTQQLSVYPGPMLGYERRCYVSCGTWSSVDHFHTTSQYRPFLLSCTKAACLQYLTLSHWLLNGVRDDQMPTPT